jgi:hypothetical protein
MSRLKTIVFSVSLFFLAGNAFSQKALLGIDTPTARQMYISCVLAANDLTLEQSALESPVTCFTTLIELMTKREGKDNRNAGQKDGTWNFCLPETTNPGVMMIDTYILEYEKAFGSDRSSFNPDSLSGKAVFAIALARKFPCM